MPSSARRTAALVLMAVAPVALLLGFLQEALLAAGILNTHDLRGVAGTVPGTAVDYLLNAWCWDGALLLLWALGAPGFFVGLWLWVRAPRAALAAPGQAGTPGPGTRDGRDGAGSSSSSR
ncbi:MAG: hypothetical protein RJA22_442 [Verrucomicrobiota bacterium]|jgi:hypothetical protein